MSTKECFVVLNSENLVPADKDNPKVRKSAEVFGGVERKGLANITNMEREPKTVTLGEKSQFIPASTKEYINEIKKENMALMKLLAERNKIIEMTGIELHKLRVNLQKLQQQNFQLARSNSQMLAELTLDKDRLRLLQHELGCRKGLLFAKGLELEEREETIPFQIIDQGVGMHKGEETLESSESSRDTSKSFNIALKSSEALKDNKKPFNMNRRQQSKRLDSSSVKQLKDKKAYNKRLCVRRQSAGFKTEETNPAEDLIEVETTRLASDTLQINQMLEDVSASILLVERKNNTTDCKSLPLRRQSARLKSEAAKLAEDLFQVELTGVPSDPLHNDQLHEDVSTSTSLLEKEDTISDSRRPPVRRRSARFSEESKPDELLFELDSARQSTRCTSLQNDWRQEDFSSFRCVSVEKDDKENTCAGSNQAQDIGRTSIGRPSRVAAKKVNSYKEIPLNVKMRRAE